MFFGKLKEETPPLNWHELVFPVLMKSISLDEIIKNDSDRKKIIDVKNRLCAHPFRSLIIDFCKDPFSSRWEWRECGRSGYGIERYIFTDSLTDVDFKMYNFNGPANKLCESGLTLYINDNKNIITYDEILFFYVVLLGFNMINENLSSLREKQKLYAERESLKEVYK